MFDGRARSERAARLAMLDEREVRWYRSLYWRVAISLIALLAVLLGAEATMFLTLSANKAGALPNNDAGQMALLVASDVSDALKARKDLDLRQYLRDKYGNYFQTILVFTMRDGSVVANHDDIEPEESELARTSLFDRRGGRGGRGFFGRGGPPPESYGPLPQGPGPIVSQGRAESGSSGPVTARTTPSDGRNGGPPADGRGGGPRPDGRGPSGGPRGDRADGRGGPPPDARDGFQFPNGPQGAFGRGPRDPFWDGDAVRRRGSAVIAAVLVDNVVTGSVVVMSGDPPFRRVVSVVGRSMSLVAGGVLLVGGCVIALVVFGPARRRLRQVQDATEQLGAGDLTARAPEEGGDEITALSRSFNRMADELTRRAQALESSDRARRQLLADVSHELMTPLTAMRGYIETLSMVELQLDAPTRERYMRIVSAETTRLENIIGDLLDLARLEGGGTSMRRERVAVESLFERVAERHERELVTRRITLATDVKAGAEQLIGDPDRLEQALQNLVANALRYTPEDGQISLVAERREARFVIIVRDSGGGIPDDQLGLIFDRFFKGDASRKSAAGSGLGLSIVKAIIERHGGTITVRNEGGAVFEISLP